MSNPIIEKLRKLIEHEKSARQLGSIAEAEAFTAKIQELLTAYNLELTHITPDEEAEEGEVGEDFVRGDEYGIGRRDRRCEWLEDLARAVARNCYCKNLIIRGSNTQVFVGLPLNRASAIQTFKYLAGAAQRIADDELVNFKATTTYQGSWDKRTEARLWKRSFLVGFSAAISGRVSRLRRALTSGDNAKEGLMLIERTETALNAWMDQELKGKKPAPSIGGRIGDGYASGYKRGSSISMKASAGLSAGGAQ